MVAAVGSTPGCTATIVRDRLARPSQPVPVSAAVVTTMLLGVAPGIGGLASRDKPCCSCARRHLLLALCGRQPEGTKAPEDRPYIPNGPVSPAGRACADALTSLLTPLAIG